MYIVKLNEVINKQFSKINGLKGLKSEIDKLYIDHINNMTIDNMDKIYITDNDEIMDTIPKSAYYYLNNIYDIKGKKDINLTIYDGFSKDFYKLMKNFKKYEIEIMIDNKDIYNIKMKKSNSIDNNIIEKLYNIQYNYLIKRKVYNKMYNIIINGLDDNKVSDYLINKMSVKLDNIEDLDSDNAFNMYDLIKDNYNLTYNMKNGNYKIEDKENKLNKLYKILKETDEIIEIIGIEKDISVEKNYISIYDKERFDKLSNIYENSNNFSVNINVLDNKLYYNYDIHNEISNNTSKDAYLNNMIYLLNKICMKRIKLLICKYNKL